jgi:uncharacterized membrane protein YphA (DoxX/SURF4 family)
MEIALLGLRLVVGLAFAAHGAQKLFGVFGGEGIAGTAREFEQIGLRPGGFQAWAAGSTEFFGGSLIALGFVTPFPAAALIAVMVAGTLTVTLHNGFLRRKQRLRIQPGPCGDVFRPLGDRPRRLVARQRGRYRYERHALRAGCAGRGRRWRARCRGRRAPRARPEVRLLPTVRRASRLVTWSPPRSTAPWAVEPRLAYLGFVGERHERRDGHSFE